MATSSTTPLVALVSKEEATPEVRGLFEAGEAVCGRVLNTARGGERSRSRPSCRRRYRFPVIRLMSSGLTRSSTVQPSRSYSDMHCSAKPFIASTVPFSLAMK
jgi:hypothetical protein